MAPGHCLPVLVQENLAWESHGENMGTFPPLGLEFHSQYLQLPKCTGKQIRLVWGPTCSLRGNWLNEPVNLQATDSRQKLKWRERGSERGSQELSKHTVNSKGGCRTHMAWCHLRETLAGQTNSACVWIRVQNRLQMHPGSPARIPTVQGWPLTTCDYLNEIKFKARFLRHSGRISCVQQPHVASGYGIKQHRYKTFA